MEQLIRFVQRLMRIPVSRVASLSAGLLSVVVLYQLARISWLLVIPPPSAQPPWQPPKHGALASTQQHQIDLNQLALFGQVTDESEDAQPLQQVTDAPQTRLDLILTGVVASNIDRASSAVIEAQGTQETYGIGDKIRSTSAVLREVHGDRVIISQRGRLETLMLDGFDYQAPPELRNPSKNNVRPPALRSAVAPRRVDKREEIRVREQLARTRDTIIEDPAAITDYIRVSPVRKDQQLVGYRLNPGKDRQLFAQSGLKANDLAVSINGYDLTDLAQSMEVMAELSTLSDIAITVDRDGQLVEILFNLPGQ